MKKYPDWYWNLIFFYHRIKHLFKKKKTDYLTLVCPDCLLPLDIATDIDYIDYGTCLECKQVQWVDYLGEVKPIARVILGKG